MAPDEISFIFGVAFGLFTMGMLVGKSLEARLWRSKADDAYGRTAMCSNGEFFYVVPEHEYVELDLMRLRATHPKFAAVIDEIKEGE